MSVSVVSRVSTPHPLPDPPPAVKPVVVRAAPPAPVPADTVTINSAGEAQSPVSADTAGDGR
ncbi:hypothetical protein [Granulicella aggregans]|jgi:hypothetical protein|uniref:hypothetical protein n=1 Tax=Granulicella aggregans TaxID=474949 RepID=UPI0021E0C5A5|nr:hypothetical protein [Granulicella aggregans]